MHWIAAGFLMFFCSVAMYLFVRKSVALNIPSQFSNLFMFAVPLGMYSVIAAATHSALSVSWYQLLIIAVSAVFFSYLGNAISLKSIEYAPNPGYSLVISKSYVVFTALASIVLFSSPLTLRAALAIMLIVASSPFILINNKGTVSPARVRPVWLPLAIGAFFCWGMLTITSKYLLIIGVNVLSRLIYSMAIVMVLIVGEMSWKKIRLKQLSLHQWLNLLVIGVLSAGFNYGMQEGFVTAPNIGYINAMNASSMGFVVIGSAIFFRDDLTIRTFIGVFGVIAGLILLVL